MKIEKVVAKILTIVPESSKNKVVRFLQDEHPLLWEEALEKTKQDRYEELYEICDREHAGCNDECPVFKLAISENEFKENIANDCPYFKNGKLMHERLNGVKLSTKDMHKKLNETNLSTENMQDKITKEQFLHYVKLQMSGTTNMFGFDKDIQREDNYSKCDEHFIKNKKETPLFLDKDGLVFE